LNTVRRTRETERQGETEGKEVAVESGLILRHRHIAGEPAAPADLGGAVRRLCQRGAGHLRPVPEQWRSQVVRITLSCRSSPSLRRYYPSSFCLCTHLSLCLLLSPDGSAGMCRTVWSVCCRTATMDRDPSTRPAVRSASCRCRPKTPSWYAVAVLCCLSVLSPLSCGWTL
jgi:hypothetical protein